MSEHDKECPICFEEYSRDKYILLDGNSNHEITESSCQHWFCCLCIKNFNEYGIVICPLCRGDISQLVASYDESENESEDESEDEDDNNSVVEDTIST